MVSGCDGSVSRVRGCEIGDAVYFLTRALGTLPFILSQDRVSNALDLSASLERSPRTSLESWVKRLSYPSHINACRGFLPHHSQRNVLSFGFFYSVAWKLWSWHRVFKLRKPLNARPTISCLRPFLSDSELHYKLTYQRWVTPRLPLLALYILMLAVCQFCPSIDYITKTLNNALFHMSICVAW